jgi:hypothetical protein
MHHLKTSNRFLSSLQVDLRKACTWSLTTYRCAALGLYDKDIKGQDRRRREQRGRKSRPPRWRTWRECSKVRPSPALPRCGCVKRPPLRTRAHHYALDGSRCFQQHLLPDADKTVGCSSYSVGPPSPVTAPPPCAGPSPPPPVSAPSPRAGRSSSACRSLLLLRWSLLHLHVPVAAQGHGACTPWRGW